MPGRDGGDERAGGGGIRTGRLPVGRGRRVLTQLGRLPADALGQCLDDLAQGCTDEVVGASGGRLAVEHRHHQTKRLGLGEDDRRQPRPAAEPVPAMGSPG